MKKLTKNLYAMIALGLVSGSVSAKDIYIAADGSDGNSGLAASAPRATLTGLNDIIEAGDVIHVSGMIDMSKEIALTDGKTDKGQTWGHWFTTADGKQTGFYINASNTPAGSPWKGVTFEGEDSMSDGFDGKDATRLFYVRGDNKETSVTFKNLSFVNGLAPGEGGGAIFIHDNGFVDIENCVFDSNHLSFETLTVDGNVLKNPTSERGGAIAMQTGRLDIKNSEFVNNKNRRGGAIFVSGGKVSMFNNVFSWNGAADIPGHDGLYLDNTRGGAICLWPLNTELQATIDHCRFIENTVWNMAGALYLYNNTDGGNLLDVLVTNSAFIGNESVNGNSGAILINNSENVGAKDDKCKNILVTIANTSIFENKAKSEGGAIFLSGGLPGDYLRMINCTVVNNITQGNAGHGAGYAESVANDIYTPDDVERSFYNCVFEYNTAPSASNGAGEYADFTTRFGYQNIDNCHIGRIVALNMPADEFVASLNNGKGTENLTYNTSILNFGDEGNTFVIPEENLYYYSYSSGNLPFVAFNEGCELFGKGNPAYLSASEGDIVAKNGRSFGTLGYNVSESDQMGFKRPEGACAIGAIEATLESMMVPDEEGNSYFDGKEFPYIAGSDIACVMDSESNLDRTVNYANGIFAAADAEISVYGVSGAKVAEGYGQLSLGNLAGGVYIVRVSANGVSKSFKVVK